MKWYLCFKSSQNSSSVSLSWVYWRAKSENGYVGQKEFP